MIEFVIYDDEKIFRDKIRNSVSKVMSKTNIEYSVEEFSKCDTKMKKIIDGNNPKIYIMDIEVPNSMSGIDVARKIRQKDWNSIIILVTSHVDMSYEAVKAQIMLLDFISKFSDCSINLEKVIRKAISKIDNKKVLTFDNNNMTYRVYTDDIYYIIKDNVERKCIIITEYGDITINETIGSLLKKLDQRFLLSHRSCIVNTEKISKIDWKNCIIYFNNDAKIDYLSRDKKKELKEYVEIK